MPISERCVIDLLITKSVEQFYTLVKENTPGKFWLHNTRYTIKLTGCTIPGTRLNIPGAQ